MEDPSTVPRRRAEPPRGRYGQDRQLRDYAYEVVADVLESVDTDEFEGNIVYWGDGRLKFVVERLISDDDANARRFVNEASMMLFNDMLNCAVSSRISLMMKCAGTVPYNPSSGGRAHAWCFNSHRANAEAEAAVPARRLGLEAALENGDLQSLTLDVRAALYDGVRLLVGGVHEVHIFEVDLRRFTAVVDLTTQEKASLLCGDNADEMYPRCEVRVWPEQCAAAKTERRLQLRGMSSSRHLNTLRDVKGADRSPQVTGPISVFGMFSLWVQDFDAVYRTKQKAGLMMLSRLRGYAACGGYAACDGYAARGGCAVCGGYAA
ncbi:hypothetical protein M885DRAFT_570020 [Pelagophyceae sp. CCMP2097]|nr:hypothetical protein M885DRAFT_570020 [Pelagophyceae sp. CCMP2097]